MSKQWCILRCAGQNTLPLMRSLTKAGFECWTPSEIRTRRVARANVKRKIVTAMFPGYLFADATRLIDLIQLSNAPVSEHRDFTVYRHLNRFPVIEDDALAPVRLSERKVAPAPEGLKPGEIVRLTAGAYAGLRGEVVKGGTKFTTVRIPGFPSPLKVAAYYLLREDSRSCIMLAA